MSPVEVHAADWNLPAAHGAQAAHCLPDPTKPKLQLQTATPVDAVHVACESHPAVSQGEEDDEHDAMAPNAARARPRAMTRWIMGSTFFLRNSRQNLNGCDSVVDPMTNERATARALLCKVPQVTVFFWVIKVLCTTVGETASDFLNVNMGLGLKGTAVAAGICLAIVLALQFRTKRYVPAVYWLAVVLISVFGTLMTDILTDSLHFPLEASTVIFSALLGLTFAAWFTKEGTLSIHSIFTARREAFYWLAILFTFALGTATGDLIAEKLGVGYLLTGVIVLCVIGAAALARRLGLDSVLAFWIAYILTRPLGASLGDYLSQSQTNGGLGLGATVTSVVFLAAILAVVVYLAVTHRDLIVEPEPAQKSGRGAILQVAVVVVVLLAVGGGGYALRSSQLQRQAEAAVSLDHPLGDLSAFQTIAKDMLPLVCAGDWKGVKSKADDLESAWDTAQGSMRPMNPDKWTLMDKAIDDVLETTRAASHTVTASGAAVEKLIAVIDSL